MHSALYVSKTGLSAQDKQLTTVSNNLANASTVGYKRDRAVFEDLLYQVERQPGGQESQDSRLPSGLQLGTGVRVVGTQKEFTNGSLQVTEQPLDVAISGRGFLQVAMPDGTVGYTRNGQLHLDAEGNVVTAGGLLLEPAITLPEATTSITIGTDGTISVTLGNDPDAQEVGVMELVDFVNPAGLEAAGANIFRETAASGNPQVGLAGENGLGQLMQGSLENSNVDVVEEMVNMITTQRVYEMNSKVVSTADQMLQYLNQNV